MPTCSGGTPAWPMALTRASCRIPASWSPGRAWSSSTRSARDPGRGDDAGHPRRDEAIDPPRHPQPLPRRPLLRPAGIQGRGCRDPGARTGPRLPCPGLLGSPSREGNRSRSRWADCTSRTPRTKTAIPTTRSCRNSRTARSSSGCNNTLEGRKIDRKRILPEATVVPSGVAEVARLQSQEGYAYIKP